MWGQERRQNQREWHTGRYIHFSAYSSIWYKAFKILVRKVGRRAVVRTTNLLTPLCSGAQWRANWSNLVAGSFLVKVGMNPRKQRLSKHCSKSLVEVALLHLQCKKKKGWATVGPRVDFSPLSKSWEIRGCKGSSSVSIGTGHSPAETNLLKSEFIKVII